MNKFFFTSTLALLFIAQTAFAQGGAPRVLDNGAEATCKADPVGFFNNFTSSDQMKFEFRTMSPTADETENGVLFQIDAVIMTAGKGAKSVANSMKAKKIFKPGEVMTATDLFDKNDLLFSNKYLSKLKPGRYKVVFSMAAASPGERKKYKTSRKVFDFVWR